MRNLFRVRLCPEKFNFRKILIPLLFMAFQLCHAEKINFLLNCAPRGENGNSGVMEVPLEFDERWFSQSSFCYSHEIARLACFFSDSSYADVLGNRDGNLLKKNYSLLGIKEKDMEFHYNVDYSDSIWGNDQCAYSFASKEIDGADGKRNLIFLVVRGTPLNANEWLSNLNINDVGEKQDLIHKGFARAASVIHTDFISFMLRHKIDPTESSLLITGHSRGAAVANLLSVALLNDDFFREGTVFTYTFASPNVTTDPLSQSERYGFIWNIVNAEDIVPTVPLNRGSWKFRKYGNTRVFANAANVERGFFDNGIFPKVSSFYEKISGREYAPFTTGPFVPILITKFTEALASNVENYYSGFLSLHTNFSSLMKKLFPDREDTETETPGDVEKGGVGSWFLGWLNRRTGGRVDYLKLAFADMHSNDVYLSFMLSLEADEIFSDRGYSVAIIKGSEEFAVFDSGKNVMARVINGRIKYDSIRLPVMLVPAIGKTVIAGCPSTETFTVALTDETIIPTPTPVTVEYFDAAGVYIKTSENQCLYPGAGRVYEFKIGEELLRNFDRGDGKIARQRMEKSEAKSAVKAASLKPRLVFNIIPELYTDTNWNLGFAIHAGNPLLFGSVMTSQGVTKFGKIVEVSPGIGNQVSIFKNIKFEGEIFAKCLWIEKNDDDDSLFNLVPEFRASLSMKTIGRFTVFSASVFEFKIDSFNDGAFDSYARLTQIPTFRISDRVKVAPSIQFGVRF